MTALLSDYVVLRIYHAHQHDLEEEAERDRVAKLSPNIISKIPAGSLKWRFWRKEEAK